MIPENPVATPALVIFSRDTLGNAVITCGGTECVYPRPGLVIFAVPDNTPFTTLRVADAVVPIPTPIALGADILTSTVDPVYPDPPLPIVSALIVPAADTVAVIAAATGSPEVFTNNASILIGLHTS